MFYRKIVLPILAFIFGFLPEGLSRKFWGTYLCLLYSDWYNPYKKLVITYHRDALFELDFNYRMTEARLELARAQAKGIRPSDAKHPVIDDVLDKERLGRHW